MFNQAKVVKCLEKLVGFEQNTNPELPTLEDDLLTPESGITVDTLHPLLSIENMVYTMDSVYTKSDESDAAFSKWLRDKRSRYINILVNEIASAKNLAQNSQELLTEVKLYDGTGNFNNKIVKQGRFVGYRIETIQNDISLLFRNIGLQLDTLNPDFKLYIYHSSQSEPLTTISVTHDKAISFTWYEFPVQILPKVQGDGGYLIGYYEDELVGQAIHKEQFFKRAPSCSSCNAVNYDLHKKWSKYIAMQPFYVNHGDLNEDKTKWEESAEIYTDGSNYGINVSFSIVCDPSELFCRNRELFVDIIGKKLAYEFVTSMGYSLRDNNSRQKISGLAFLAIKEELKPALDNAIKSINFSTEGLNPICLPCQDNYQRITHSSVYR